EYVRLGQLLVHPVLDHAGGRVVPEQVVHGRGQLERPLVPVPAHRVDPARVDHPGPEHPRGLLGQAAGAHRLGPVRVADVRGGVAPGQRAHHGDHAAVVLEVVVRVGDVVLAGVDVLRRHGDAAVHPVEVVPGGPAVEAANIGDAAPARVHLGLVTGGLHVS